MTIDRTITIISVVVAIVASTAGTVQSYVSWNARNNTLTSAALGQVVKSCHDIAVVASSLIFTKRGTESEKIDLLNSNVAGLDVVVAALYPKDNAPFRTEVSDFLHEMIQAPLDDDRMAIQEIQIRFTGKLASRCSEIIRRQLRS
jgi:hypothetical protein